jgi:peptidoglycan/LPS O-acetylase OafA/YrhL
MDEDTASHEIARLELQIEALAAAIERCRKIAFAAKTAIAGGALWFVLALLWILPFNPTYFVGALAATLGGVVLLGSNKTTWEETEAALARSEAARATLIGQIPLRVVSRAPDTPTLH